MEPWLFIPLPLTFCCSHDLGNHDVLTGTFADMAVSLKFESFHFSAHPQLASQTKPDCTSITHD